MYDVNPLRPTMHLKQIEREALALRSATAKNSSRDLSIRAPILGVLKRLFMPLRPEVKLGDRFNLGKH